ncbi:hypothetical protein SUGI_0224640 [Cryptomeria japonica]|nr:hypothetical protein SUGI_0224640 [Cryptomeria japonica]
MNAKLNTEGRSEIEELPSPACPCCLEKIILDGCWKLQKINGIEELQGLKYLHLSAGTMPIWGCIKMWQKVPSEVTSLNWKSNADTESVLRKFNDVSSLIGLDVTVTEIPSNRAAVLVDPMTEQPSAIIILMLIESFYKGKDCRKSLKIPPIDSMVANIGEGEYIAVVVVTEEEKIIKMQHGMSNCIPTVSNGRVIKGFIVTIQQRDKSKTLPLLQYLCSQSQELINVRGNFRFRYISENLKVDFTSPNKQYDLENLVRKVMISVHSRLTDRPCIQLQSLKNLIISGGSFRRLWPRHQGGAFQLKELVLDGISLEEFPNSLEVLGHLENLVIAGMARGDFMGLGSSIITGMAMGDFMGLGTITINGRSFSESLGKLTNLRSLVLRNLTLSGELSFKDSMVSTTLGTPMVSLEKIDIRNVQNISKVSISGQYLRSLRSLNLENLVSLIEVDLGKDAKSNIGECSGHQCCLKTDIVKSCPMLHKFKAIAELKGYLHLRAGFINMWQEVPSHVTCIIWRCNFRQSIGEMKKNFDASIASSDLFDCSDVRVTKFPDDPEEELGFPVSEETCAIVMFVIFKDFPPEEWIEFLGIPSMELGWGLKPVAAAVVVREKGKMNKMQHWIRSVVRGGVDVASMATFEEREKIRVELLVDFCNRVLMWRPKFQEYNPIFSWGCLSLFSV